MKKLLLLLVLAALPAFAAECPKTADNFSVNISSATDTTVAAGRPGYKIFIWEVVLENKDASTDVTVTLKNGSTAINGAGFLLGPKGSWSRQCGGLALDMSTGNSLVLTTSASPNVSGYIKFTYEPE